jgi:aspartate-semialdehyde dehydrogenase
VTQTSQTAELGSRADAGTKTVAVVGATGAVGAEMLRCLEESSYPTGALKAFASERSAGKRFKFRGRDVEMQVLTEDAFAGCDVVLFASETDISKQYVPIAVKAGAYAIDNSSAFRMDASVPLVVPEVNGDLITPTQKIYANPNCVAAIMVMALWPLHQAGKLKRVIASTYQSASGAGRPAMDELEEATRAYLKGEHYEPRVLPHPYAFNLFSHNTEIDPETGYNDEETKVIRELRKIFGEPDLRASATCVRVPVLRAHSIALNVTFDRPMTPARAREILGAAPGLKIVDDAARNHFPMPNEASGQDDVRVGRIREDVSDGSGRSLALFVAGDQLLKGAALNAVQIAEMVRG